jgi:hypothetical protein
MPATGIEIEDNTIRSIQPIHSGVQTEPTFMSEQNSPPSDRWSLNAALKRWVPR